MNPSRLATVDYTHAHAQGHTLKETDAVHWSSGQPIAARGAWGYGALLKGMFAVARRWTDTPPAVFRLNLFSNKCHLEALQRYNSILCNKILIQSNQIH